MADEKELKDEELEQVNGGKVNPLIMTQVATAGIAVSMIAGADIPGLEGIGPSSFDPVKGGQLVLGQDVCLDFNCDTCPNQDKKGKMKMCIACKANQ